VKSAEGILRENGYRKFIEIDNTFHGIIFQSTQNPILQEILENIHCRCERLWSSALSESIPLPEVIGHLKEIYLALKKRDAERASQLLENHVRHFIDLIKNQLL
jgi:DNA-binding GntR family transcriptional regulator